MGTCFKTKNLLDKKKMASYRSSGVIQVSTSTEIPNLFEKTFFILTELLGVFFNFFFQYSTVAFSTNPHRLPSVIGNAATLFCCEAPEMFG